MADNRRPAPLAQTGGHTRPLCPVCGTTSYSRDGIHPQCAQARADLRRMTRVKSRKKLAKPKIDNPMALSPWHKRCPRCKATVHVRKLKCDCGHEFESSPVR